MLAKALEYATEKHKGRKRKNSRADDYIMRPREVASIIGNVYTDEKILCAALLHDTVDDTDATYEDITKRFGPEVANIVAEVTDDKSLPKLERKQLQVSTMATKSLGARLVKIADKLSNTRELKTDPPVGWTDIAINGYIAWSYAVCLEAMSPGDINPRLVKLVDEHFRLLMNFDYTSALDKYYGSL